MNLIERARKNVAAHSAGFEPVTEVRHLLTEEERDFADSQVRDLILENVRQSGLFRSDAVDRVAHVILIEPTVERVLTSGAAANREEKGRLGLGRHIGLGTDFSGSVLDMRGSAAIEFVRQIFAQLQTRHRCTMLRALGARHDLSTRNLHVRLHAGETSCVDSLDCDGDIYGLADIPDFPLPGCQSRECPCSLELIVAPGTPSGEPSRLLGRLAHLFKRHR